MKPGARPGIHPAHRRATLAYVLAVVAPALALSVLGLLSIDRERRALDAQAATTARQTMEQLAETLEHRVWASAETCLREAGIDVGDAPSDSASPALRRAMRQRLDAVRIHHPVAAALVVWQGDRLLLPEAWHPPRRLHQLLAGESPALRAQFASLFERAEALELRESRPAEAGLVYRRASEFPVSAELRALALSRAARCSANANDRAAAEGAYRRVLTEFADQYDLSNQPHGVVAALELDDLTPDSSGNARALLERVARDVNEGRWELTGDAAAYFVRALDQRLGRGKVERTSAYLAYLELAKRLQRYPRPAGPLRVGEVVPVPVAAGPQSELLFYVRTAGDLMIGLVVDLQWVQRQLLPTTVADLRIFQPVGVAANPDGATPGATHDASVQVPFRSLFPFWMLEIRRPRPGALGSTLLFAGSAAAMVAVLVLGVILLVRDASQEAALSRLRSGFVSGVSHELKTPLTLIRMYGEMLSGDPAAPEHERRGYYTIITRESERLTRLIDRVLEFSRIERGSRRYTLERLDLMTLVRETHGDYEPFLRQRGFVLEAHLSPVPSIDADADAVREAIGNVLDNAAKYSGESRRIALHLFERAGEAVVEVRDHGLGIDSGLRARLFEPYERGQHTGKGGYGLGLYLVKHVMDGHGGRIEVDSRPGKGSTFGLVFPTAAATRVLAAPSPAGARGGQET